MSFWNPNLMDTLQEASIIKKQVCGKWVRWIIIWCFKVICGSDTPYFQWATLSLNLWTRISLPIVLQISTQPGERRVGAKENWAISSFIMLTKHYLHLSDLMMCPFSQMRNVKKIKKFQIRSLDNHFIADDSTRKLSHEEETDCGLFTWRTPFLETIPSNLAALLQEVGSTSSSSSRSVWS